MRRFVLLFAMFAAVPLRADDLSGFEKILLPVVTKDSITGVGGKFSAGADVYSPVPCRVDGARFFGGGLLTDTVSGDGSLHVDLPNSSRAFGRFVYVERACAEQLSISLMVASPAGIVALPVARERDWRSGKTEFLGTSFSYRNLTIPAARLKLRVFDFDGTGKGEILVREMLIFYNASSGQRLLLDRRDGDDAGSPFYGELDIPYPCARITNSQPDCLGFGIRVEIVPLSPGLRYWALLTSTDNETQQIFAPLPQP